MIRKALSLLAAAFAVLASVVVVAPSATAHADATLHGGGSSFAQLEIDQWRAETGRAPYSLKVVYAAQGSSFGRQQYIQGNLDFAASDIPFLPQELSSMGGSRTPSNFAYVPVSAGGLGFMYNLTDQNGNQITNLRLTRNAACRIFTVANMTWDDPEIQAANPGIALPAVPITPIVRQDGSGTSYVLSEFCITIANGVWGDFVRNRTAVDSSLDPAFRDGKPTSNWPQGWGTVGSGLGAEGVAGIVSSTPNAITYNEAGFAAIRGFPNASVQNAAGQFTQPDEEAVSVALSYAEGNGDGTFRLHYEGPDAKAYFPSTYSYVIAQTTGFDPAKGLVLAKFLCYAVTKGQRIELTQTLHYARLSAPLVDLARTGIAKIPGAPPWDQCKVESAPPPPAATPKPDPANPQPSQQPAAGATPAGGATPSAGTPTAGAPSAGTPSAGAGSANPGGVAAPSGGSGAGTPAAPGASGGGRSTNSSIVIDPITSSSIVVDVASRCVGAPSGSEATTTTLADSTTTSGATTTSTGGSTTTTDLASTTTLPPCPAVATDSPRPGGAVPPTTVGGATGAPIGATATTLATPAAKNPAIGAGPGHPDANRIVWWLLQGAAVCALGVGLAGVRRRAT